jgi:uncharacterized protein YneF (UPF0154 family)
MSAHDEEEQSEAVIDLREVSFVDDIGLGVSLCDICTEVVVGQSMNEAVASVTDMFLSHTKVSTSDVISLIATIPSLDKTDEKELIQTVLAVSNQGSISNYAWSGALRSVLDSGKDAVDGGSIVLQKDSAFVLQSFMNTVLMVAQVVFSAILVALAAVLNGLLAIIAGVISTVLTAFRSFTTEIDIDPDSNNEYVQGVFGANASFTRDQFTNGYVLKSESAIRSVIGPFELFTWTTSNSQDATVNMNMFMNLSFNAVELMEDVLDNVSYSSTGEYGKENLTFEFSFGFRPYNSIAMDDDFAHDTDYLVRLHFDKDALLRQYKMCTMVSALALLEKGGVYTGKLGWGGLRLENNGPIETMISILLDCIYICKSNSSSPVDLSDAVLPSVTQCRDYLNAIRDCFDGVDEIFDVPTSFTVKQQKTSAGWGGKYTSSIINGISSCFRPLVDFSEFGSRLQIGDEEWDQLIPAPSVTLPNLSTTEVVAAIGLVIGAVGAAFLASKSISRRLKARRQVKLARRTDVLNDKRNAYLSNPGDKTLKQEYTSALIAYDKRASLFGWPSYDAVNGRMNVNSHGGAASSMLNGFLNTTDTTEYIASLIK